MILVPLGFLLAFKLIANVTSSYKRSLLLAFCLSHTDYKFYSQAGSLNQHTALGFPTDCQLTQAGLESVLSPIWSGMWTLGLKE